MSKWNINGSNLTKKQKIDLEQELVSRGIDVTGLVTGAKLFIARNNLKSIPVCVSCGKQLAFHSPSCSYRTFCSARCSANSNETINKRRATNLTKYGTINVLTINAKQRKEKQFKRDYCNFDRFSSKVIPNFDAEDFTGRCSRTEYDWLCVRCNNTFSRLFVPHLQKWPKCPTCDGAFTDIEEAVRNFLERHKIEYKSHYRKIIKAHELDFFVPSLQMAIETNGLFYHTERFFPDKKYHKNKTNLCLEQNVKLVQIFSDEIYLNPKACFGRLRALFGLNRKIDARKCRIDTVSAKTASAFLNKYHTQGSDKASIRYGLFYKNRLVSVMTFCKLRKILGQTSADGNWELSRYVCINGFSVRGGFQKLMKAFIKTNKPTTLISYCDKRWTPDPKTSVYARAGFSYVRTTEPNYWYVGKGLKKLHRANFQKHALLKKYPKYDSSFTEKQIMEDLGYSRVWDCGHHKFEITFP